MQRYLMVVEDGEIEVCIASIGHSIHQIQQTICIFFKSIKKVQI